MNNTILSEHLLKALSIVGKIPMKGNLPILENVFIEAKEGRVIFRTSNLEMGVTTSIGGKVETEGIVTVSYKLFNEFIHAIRAEKINLFVREEVLHVETERSSATFPTITAAEFPAFPAKDSSLFSLSVDDLGKIAKQICVSASTDEGRPMLTGIKFKPLEAGVLVAATDGFRLSVRKFNTFSGATIDGIIPARIFSDIVKIANDTKQQEPLALSYTKEKNQIIFALTDTDVFTRLIEGEFPPFERIIPASHTTQVTVSKDELAQGVKAAAIFARESANIIRFTIKSDKLILSANTAQVGSSKVEIDAAVVGDENEIAFNYRFLIDFLNSVEEDEVVLKMTNPLAPGLFHPKEDKAYTHIIMPVRVQA